MNIDDIQDFTEIKKINFGNINLNLDENLNINIIQDISIEIKKPIEKIETKITVLPSGRKSKSKKLF